MILWRKDVSRSRLLFDQLSLEMSFESFCENEPDSKWVSRHGIRGCVLCFARDRLCSNQWHSIVVMAWRAEVVWRVRKEVRWGRRQKDSIERGKEEGGPLARAYRERTRSSTARHQDIRDFDRTARSTTAQSLFVWHPLPLLFSQHASPSTLASVSFPRPFLPFFHRSCFHVSLSLSPHIHLDTSDPGSLIPSSSSPKLVFVSFLSLLRYRVPISEASRLHVACPNDVLERTGTTAI